MFSLKKILLLGFLLPFWGQGHAETSIALAQDRHGSAWFLVGTSPADAAGALRLRVEFPRVRSFRSFHQVKTADLFVRFSCPEETMAIERINLLGESGDEIGRIAASGLAPSAAHHLPEMILRAALGHACAKADFHHQDGPLS